ncbi:Z1 domain-containing protein [Streptomyces sp. NPDC086779]|uniref:Z1 domain-containing protein n=1 Tax=Streptomyces sp. NPDC086779 TaxID=3156670 RepID=UPI003432BCBD
MNASHALTDAYLAALKLMEARGPRPLHAAAEFAADDFDTSSVQTGDPELCGHLRSVGANDPLRIQMHLSVAGWDAAQPTASWTQHTEAGSEKRRAVIIDRLRVDEKTSQLFLELFPIAERGRPTVITSAEHWVPWYTEGLASDRGFYWGHYRNYLIEKGWSAEDIANSLGPATTRVVERLADPTADKPYRSKGLVIGYVQSGKTANFTGVIAKAVDVGYRLVIVLTGTTDKLRSQTQRRLDMEFAGVDSVLGGIDPADEYALDDVDYQQDKEWVAGRFIDHGQIPAGARIPEVHRLTRHHQDYQSGAIRALDFHGTDPTKPLYHPDNVFPEAVRLAVVKKNSGVLKRVIKDLKKVYSRLPGIPALIIDDESDQASINTNRKRWFEEEAERTAINAAISELLEMLPRAQYVGYTATPFANVFIDPGDPHSLFPKDFLVSLDRPNGYMGASDFNDDDSSTEREEKTFENSPEKCHVRFLPGRKDDDSKLGEALDAFVLSGAVKLFREGTGMDAFKHHTMLVHEAQKKTVHRDQAENIKRHWRRAGYSSAKSYERLRNLYLRDIAPASSAMFTDLPIPAGFDELKPYIAEAVALIEQTGQPVLVVNSDKIEGEELDFDSSPVWRILIGGNMLARGFTVEGLTVTYYRRAARTADTLMQMGRWFGFRKNYRDLVRLYIPKGLHETFAGICQDEEFFRNQLDKYAKMDDDGQPLITPQRIVPLVAQHSSVKPTAANKRWCAILEQDATDVKEPSSAYPPLDEKAKLRDNVEAFRPIFAGMSGPHPAPQVSKSLTIFQADFSHGLIVKILDKLSWLDEEKFQADLRWLKTLKPSQVDRWHVVMPQLLDAATAIPLLNFGPFSLHSRNDIEKRLQAKSQPIHHQLLHEVVRAPGSRTAGMLLYPMIAKPDEETLRFDSTRIVMAFRLELPSAAKPKDGRVLKYRVDSSL